ncbi:hypothetical protein FQA39_LY13782 [Lamprigera yunnana]|nr:hypothetical protein FQA39_LY13782 [Lamprigera yunnana]
MEKENQVPEWSAEPGEEDFRNLETLSDESEPDASSEQSLHNTNTDATDSEPSDNNNNQKMFSGLKYTYWQRRVH